MAKHHPAGNCWMNFQKPMANGKYPRTYHFPFSPGASSDDKVCADWEPITKERLVITEKLDGENTCLKSSGVYARSHSAPTRNPWAQNMWPIWERIRYDLNDLEIFGENLYGVHSIEYSQLTAYFYVFGMRIGESWLPWNEVLQYCYLLDLPLAPVFQEGIFTPMVLKTTILEGMQVPSALGGLREGFVVRSMEGFMEDDFSQKVLKFVRPNHVQTDEHWTRNWQKAKLAGF
jgi:hypothetical protein